MSANLTPTQQVVADKVLRKAQEDPSFRNRLVENEGEALREAGLLDDYAVAFTDDVSGYVREVEAGGSTCCVSDISGSCCLSCWFTDITLA